MNSAAQPLCASRVATDSSLLDAALREGAATSEPLSPALWQCALSAPLAHVLSRPSKGFRGRLALCTYRLAGGRGPAPAALAQVVELMHAGSLVIDDVEDDSRERRGAPSLHRVYGHALAINTGNWLYFRPAELLLELGLAPRRELAMHRWFARTMCRAHRGQALDLAVRVGALTQAEVAPVARAIAELKTGALMAFAARLGATVAGAPAQVVEALAAFGSALGIALQQLDDCGGVLSVRMRDKGHEDLRFERVTFPWALFSRELDPGRYRALCERLAHDTPIDREALRASMREALLALDGPEAPKRSLTRALDALHDALDVDRTALAELEDELARLEVSYG